MRPHSQVALIIWSFMLDHKYLCNEKRYCNNFFILGLDCILSISKLKYVLFLFWFQKWIYNWAIWYCRSYWMLGSFISNIYYVKINNFQWIVLHWISLNCFVLNFTELHCIEFHWILFNYIELNCIVFTLYQIVLCAHLHCLTIWILFIGYSM